MTKDDLGFPILLPDPQERWEYRHEPPCLIYSVTGKALKALCSALHKDQASALPTEQHLQACRLMSSDKEYFIPGSSLFCSIIKK